MFHPRPRKFPRKFPQKPLVLLVCLLAVGLSACAGKHRHAPSEDALAVTSGLLPESRPLAVGDRIEVTLIQPEVEPGRRRLLAVVDDQGQVNFPGLPGEAAEETRGDASAEIPGAEARRDKPAMAHPSGGAGELPGAGTFDAAGRTPRQLEVAMFERLNANGQARGTVRLRRAPIVHDGVFLLPDAQTFEAIIADAEQMAQLDRHEHPTWQWLMVPTPRVAAQTIPITTRQGKHWTLGRPAHPQLVGDPFHAGIEHAGPADEQAAALELDAPTAIAVEKVATHHAGQAVVLALDGQVAALPLLDAKNGRHVTLVGGPYPLDRAEVQALVHRLGEPSRMEARGRRGDKVSG